MFVPRSVCGAWTLLVGGGPEALDRMKLLARNLSEGQTISWSLLGLNLCRRAWKALHNMGDLSIYEIIIKCDKKDKS